MTGVTAVLVGRDAELRVLERALDVLDGGRARAIGFVGEPGSASRGCSASSVLAPRSAATR